MNECKSLSSYLWEFKISHKELSKILCKSERTLRRWENSPPEWVINVIKKVGNRENIPESWLGWYFNDELLYDSDGNHYDKNEIRTIWVQRHINSDLIGSRSNIYSMKKEIENKLKMLNSKIIIQLVNDQNILEEVQFKI